MKTARTAQSPTAASQSSPLSLTARTRSSSACTPRSAALYYEQAKDAPEGFFAPLFAQAEEICGRIAAKEDEINALKADIAAATGCDEADIDVEIGEFDDFDNIVDATEDDGKNE